MVDQPEDVGRTLAAGAARERAFLLDGLDDRALVLLVLVIDAIPEPSDLGVERRRFMDDLGKVADTLLAEPRVARVQPQLLRGVSFLEHCAVALVLRDRHLLVLAA